VLLAHALYYTFIIGGDHFEYRVYSHLVPLVFVALVWLLNLARLRLRTGALALAAAVLLALPVPWTHWALTHDLRTREATFQMRVPIAPHWPAPVRGYARAFDRLQDWLIERFVCARHQEHRVLHQFEIATYPSRAEGARIGPAGHPVFAGLAVGVPGWVLPNVDIIDLWGLNDYVVARADPIPAPLRRMAHDRKPPDGYVECFQPNLFLAGPGRMQVYPRDPELTDAQIVACEARWREWTNGRR
jgi:arabinofuranosyltransferase